MRNYIKKTLASLLVLAVLLPWIPLPTLAASNTLGEVTSETHFTSVSSANVFVWNYLTGSVGGTVKVGRIKNKVSSGSAGSAMVIYADNGSNQPGTLLATSDAVTVSWTTLTTTTYTFSGQNQINLSPNTRYYVGIHFADPGTPTFGWGTSIDDETANECVFSNFNDTYPGAETTFSVEDNYCFERGNLDLTYESPEGVTHYLLNSSLVKSGLRLDFDGVDERGKSGNDPTGNTNTAGAISCWVSFDSVLAADGVDWIFTLGGDDTDEATNFGQTGVMVRRQAASSITNRLEIFHRVDGSATVQRIIGNTTITTNTLYHIVANSSGTAYTLYLNGSAQTLTVVSGSNNGDWFGDIGTVGTRHFNVADAWRDGAWANNTIDAKVDSCTVFNTSLSATDVTNLYNGGKPIHPCAVVACSSVDNHWKLGEDSGGTVTTMHDSIGSASVDNFTMDNMESADIVTTSYY